MNDQQEFMACHIIVQGRVQGVGFRYFTRTQADKINVSGWVRNTPDGAVEIYAEGTRAHLKEFIDHIRSGPPGSAVGRVDIRWSTPQNQHSTFDIRH